MRKLTYSILTTILLETAVVGASIDFGSGIISQADWPTTSSSTVTTTFTSFAQSQGYNSNDLNKLLLTWNQISIAYNEPLITSVLNLAANPNKLDTLQKFARFNIDMPIIAQLCNNMSLLPTIGDSSSTFSNKMTYIGRLKDNQSTKNILSILPSSATTPSDLKTFYSLLASLATNTNLNSSSFAKLIQTQVLGGQANTLSPYDTLTSIQQTLAIPNINVLLNNSVIQSVLSSSSTAQDRINILNGYATIQPAQFTNASSFVTAHWPSSPEADQDQLNNSILKIALRQEDLNWFWNYANGTVYTPGTSTTIASGPNLLTGLSPVDRGNFLNLLYSIPQSVSDQLSFNSLTTDTVRQLEEFLIINYAAISNSNILLLTDPADRIALIASMWSSSTKNPSQWDAAFTNYNALNSTQLHNLLEGLSATSDILAALMWASSSNITGFMTAYNSGQFTGMTTWAQKVNALLPAGVSSSTYTGSDLTAFMELTNAGLLDPNSANISAQIIKLETAPSWILSVPYATWADVVSNINAFSSLSSTVQSAIHSASDFTSYRTLQNTKANLAGAIVVYGFANYNQLSLDAQAAFEIWANGGFTTTSTKINTLLSSYAALKTALMSKNIGNGLNLLQDNGSLSMTPTAIGQVIGTLVSQSSAITAAQIGQASAGNHLGTLDYQLNHDISISQRVAEITAFAQGNITSSIESIEADLFSYGFTNSQISTFFNSPSQIAVYDQMLNKSYNFFENLSNWTDFTNAITNYALVSSYSNLKTLLADFTGVDARSILAWVATAANQTAFNALVTSSYWSNFFTGISLWNDRKNMITSYYSAVVADDILSLFGSNPSGTTAQALLSFYTTNQNIYHALRVQNLFSASFALNQVDLVNALLTAGVTASEVANMNIVAVNGQMLLAANHTIGQRVTTIQYIISNNAPSSASDIVAALNIQPQDIAIATAYLETIFNIDVYVDMKNLGIFQDILTNTPSTPWSTIQASIENYKLFSQDNLNYGNTRTSLLSTLTGVNSRNFLKNYTKINADDRTRLISLAADPSLFSGYIADANAAFFENAFKAGLLTGLNTWSGISTVLNNYIIANNARDLAELLSLGADANGKRNLLAGYVADANHGIFSTAFNAGLLAGQTTWGNISTILGNYLTAQNAHLFDNLPTNQQMAAYNWYQNSTNAGNFATVYGLGLLDASLVTWPSKQIVVDQYMGITLLPNRANLLGLSATSSVKRGLLVGYTKDNNSGSFEQAFNAAFTANLLTGKTQWDGLNGIGEIVANYNTAASAHLFDNLPVSEQPAAYHWFQNQTNAANFAIVNNLGLIDSTLVTWTAKQTIIDNYIAVGQNAARLLTYGTTVSDKQALMAGYLSDQNRAYFSAVDLAGMITSPLNWAAISPILTTYADTQKAGVFNTLSTGDKILASAWYNTSLNNKATFAQANAKGLLVGITSWGTSGSGGMLDLLTHYAITSSHGEDLDHLFSLTSDITAQVALLGGYATDPLKHSFADAFNAGLLTGQTTWGNISTILGNYLTAQNAHLFDNLPASEQGAAYTWYQTSGNPALFTAASALIDANLTTWNAKLVAVNNYTTMGTNHPTDRTILLALSATPSVQRSLLAGYLADANNGLFTTVHTLNSGSLLAGLVSWNDISLVLSNYAAANTAGLFTTLLGIEVVNAYTWYYDAVHGPVHRDQFATVHAANILSGSTWNANQTVIENYFAVPAYDLNQLLSFGINASTKQALLSGYLGSNKKYLFSTTPLTGQQTWSAIEASLAIIEQVDILSDTLKSLCQSGDVATAMAWYDDPTNGIAHRTLLSQVMASGILNEQTSWAGISTILGNYTNAGNYARLLIEGASPSNAVAALANYNALPGVLTWANQTNFLNLFTTGMDIRNAIAWALVSGNTSRFNDIFAAQLTPQQMLWSDFQQIASNYAAGNTAHLFDNLPSSEQTTAYAWYQNSTNAANFATVHGLNLLDASLVTWSAKQTIIDHYVAVGNDATNLLTFGATPTAQKALLANYLTDANHGYFASVFAANMLTTTPMIWSAISTILGTYATTAKEGVFNTLSNADKSAASSWYNTSVDNKATFAAAHSIGLLAGSTTWGTSGSGGMLDVLTHYAITSAQGDASNILLLTPDVTARVALFAGYATDPLKHSFADAFNAGLLTGQTTWGNISTILGNYLTAQNAHLFDNLPASEQGAAYTWYQTSGNPALFTAASTLIDASLVTWNAKLVAVNNYTTMGTSHPTDRSILLALSATPSVQRSLLEGYLADANNALFTTVHNLNSGSLLAGLVSWNDISLVLSNYAAANTAGLFTGLAGIEIVNAYNWYYDSVYKSTHKGQFATVYAAGILSGSTWAAQQTTIENYFVALNLGLLNGISSSGAISTVLTNYSFAGNYASLFISSASSSDARTALVNYKALPGAATWTNQTNFVNLFTTGMDIRNALAWALTSGNRSKFDAIFAASLAPQQMLWSSFQQISSNYAAANAAHLFDNLLTTEKATAYAWYQNSANASNFATVYGLGLLDTSLITWSSKQTVIDNYVAVGNDATNLLGLAPAATNLEQQALLAGYLSDANHSYFAAALNANMLTGQSTWTGISNVLTGYASAAKQGVFNTLSAGDQSAASTWYNASSTNKSTFAGANAAGLLAGLTSWSGTGNMLEVFTNYATVNAAGDASTLLSLGLSAAGQRALLAGYINDAHNTLFSAAFNSTLLIGLSTWSGSISTILSNYNLASTDSVLSTLLQVGSNAVDKRASLAYYAGLSGPNQILFKAANTAKVFDNRTTLGNIQDVFAKYSTAGTDSVLTTLMAVGIDSDAKRALLNYYSSLDPATDRSTFQSANTDGIFDGLPTLDRVISAFQNYKTVTFAIAHPLLAGATASDARKALLNYITVGSDATALIALSVTPSEQRALLAGYVSDPTRSGYFSTVNTMGLTTGLVDWASIKTILVNYRKAQDNHLFEQINTSLDKYAAYNWYQTPGNSRIFALAYENALFKTTDTTWSNLLTVLTNLSIVDSFGAVGHLFEELTTATSKQNALTWYTANTNANGVVLNALMASDLLSNIENGSVGYQALVNGLTVSASNLTTIASYLDTSYASTGADRATALADLWANYSSITSASLSMLSGVTGAVAAQAIADYTQIGHTNADILIGIVGGSAANQRSILSSYLAHSYSSNFSTANTAGLFTGYTTWAQISPVLTNYGIVNGLNSSDLSILLSDGTISVANKRTMLVNYQNVPSSDRSPLMTLGEAVNVAAIYNLFAGYINSANQNLFATVYATDLLSGVVNWGAVETILQRYKTLLNVANFSSPTDMESAYNWYYASGGQTTAFIAVHGLGLLEGLSTWAPAEAVLNHYLSVNTADLDDLFHGLGNTQQKRDALTWYASGNGDVFHGLSLNNLFTNVIGNSLDYQVLVEALLTADPSLTSANITTISNYVDTTLTPNATDRANAIKTIWNNYNLVTNPALLSVTSTALANYVAVTSTIANPLISGASVTDATAALANYVAAGSDAANIMSLSGTAATQRTLLAAYVGDANKRYFAAIFAEDIGSFKPTQASWGAVSAILANYANQAAFGLFDQLTDHRANMVAWYNSATFVNLSSFADAHASGILSGITNGSTMVTVLNNYITANIDGVLNTLLAFSNDPGVQRATLASYAALGNRNLFPAANTAGLFVGLTSWNTINSAFSNYATANGDGVLSTLMMGGNNTADIANLTAYAALSSGDQSIFQAANTAGIFAGLTDWGTTNSGGMLNVLNNYSTASAHGVLSTLMMGVSSAADRVNLADYIALLGPDQTAFQATNTAGLLAGLTNWVDMNSTFTNYKTLNNWGAAGATRTSFLSLFSSVTDKRSALTWATTNSATWDGIISDTPHHGDHLADNLTTWSDIQSAIIWWSSNKTDFATAYGISGLLDNITTWSAKNAVISNYAIAGTNGSALYNLSGANIGNFRTLLSGYALYATNGTKKSYFADAVARNIFLGLPSFSTWDGIQTIMNNYTIAHSSLNDLLGAGHTLTGSDATTVLADYAALSSLSYTNIDTLVDLVSTPADKQSALAWAQDSSNREILDTLLGAGLFTGSPYTWSFVNAAVYITKDQADPLGTFNIFSALDNAHVFVSTPTLPQQYQFVGDIMKRGITVAQLTEASSDIDTTIMANQTNLNIQGLNYVTSIIKANIVSALNDTTNVNMLANLSAGIPISMGSKYTLADTLVNLGITKAQISTASICMDSTELSSHTNIDARSQYIAAIAQLYNIFTTQGFFANINGSAMSSSDKKTLLSSFTNFDMNDIQNIQNIPTGDLSTQTSLAGRISYVRLGVALNMKQELYKAYNNAAGMLTEANRVALIMALIATSVTSDKIDSVSPATLRAANTTIKAHADVTSRVNYISGL